MLSFPKLYLWFGVGLTAAITLMSQVILPKSDHIRVFPFSHWKLFSEVQETMWIYKLYVYPDQESDKDRLCELRDCEFIADKVKYGEINSLISHLGSHYSHHQGPDGGLKSQLEKYLGPNGYRLMAMEINPIEFYKSGLVKQEYEALHKTK